jgi:hypothetical protein
MRNGAGRHRQIEGGSNINGQRSSPEASLQISLTLRSRQTHHPKSGDSCMSSDLLTFAYCHVLRVIGKSRARNRWHIRSAQLEVGFTFVLSFRRLASILLQQTRVFIAVLGPAKSNDSNSSKSTCKFRTSRFRHLNKRARRLV